MMRKRSALAICLSFCLLSLSLAAEIGARSKDAKGSQSKDGAVKSTRRGRFAWFERKESDEEKSDAHHLPLAVVLSIAQKIEDTTEDIDDCMLRYYCAVGTMVSDKLIPEGSEAHELTTQMVNMADLADELDEANISTMEEFPNMYAFLSSYFTGEDTGRVRICDLLFRKCEEPAELFLEFAMVTDSFARTAAADHAPTLMSASCVGSRVSCAMCGMERRALCRDRCDTAITHCM